MSNFTHVKMLRDDADDLPASEQSGVGDLAHEARPATAVDEADRLRRKKASDNPRSLCVARVSAGARAAEDANATKDGHDNFVQEPATRRNGSRS
jgi:hypothetical protein